MRKNRERCNTDCAAPTGATGQQLVEAFWKFGPAFQRWADSQLSDKAMTPQRLRILGCLHEQGPRIMSELKDELGVSATNITALVDTLERDGLVIRKPHPRDRRATIVELAEGAKCESALGCAPYKARVAKLFSVLTEIERKEPLRILGKFDAFLKENGIT